MLKVFHHSVDAAPVLDACSSVSRQTNDVRGYRHHTLEKRYQMKVRILTSVARSPGIGSFTLPLVLSITEARLTAGECVHRRFL